MKENAARIWFLFMFVMFVFTAFLGRGWLIGIALGLMIGYIKIM